MANFSRAISLQTLTERKTALHSIGHIQVQSVTSSCLSTFLNYMWKSLSNKLNQGQNKRGWWVGVPGESQWPAKMRKRSIFPLGCCHARGKFRSSDSRGSRVVSFVPFWPCSMWTSIPFFPSLLNCQLKGGSSVIAATTSSFLMSLTSWRDINIRRWSGPCNVIPYQTIILNVRFLS
jgi:hypothetical protein